MNQKYFLFFFLPAFFFSCNENRNQPEKTEDPYRIHALPDDLSQLQAKDLEAILPMLGNAKIIATSEGTHGMIEPFYWRNELIKLLVENNQISAVALESGLVESKIVYDYVLGASISIDSVLHNGLKCGFGDIKQNRELLTWLREYNSDKPEKEKIHFYGFDIPGCAPNPVLENNYAGFEYSLNYFSQVNPEKADEFKKQLKTFVPLLRIKDGADDLLPHFTDIDSLQWIELRGIQQSMYDDLKNNESQYISLSSKTDYEWAERAVTGAGQNMDFLYSVVHSGMEYAPRERGLADNAQWIASREGKPVLLFAHIAHLTKDFSVEGNKMPYPQCGEYLGDELGENYLVIGNFYSVLDYFEEGKEEVKPGTIEEIMASKGPANYFMKVDKSDSTWNKEWPYAKPNSGGQAFMNPAEGVDIILYNKVQHWLRN